MLINKLVILLIFLITTIVGAKSNWTVEDDEMYVSGNTVHGHKFGYFKDKEWCGKELVFIQWTSYKDGLEKFKGTDMLIELSLNGKAVEKIPATYTASTKFAELMTIAEFKTIILSNELADKLKSANEIEVTFAEPKEFVAILDIKSDTFNTSSFPEPHLKTYNLCKNTK